MKSAQGDEIMKIYDWHIAPNPRRLHIYLAEKGLKIPLEEVGEGFVLKQSYCEKFPQAMVPLLELDDGTIIGEVMAICRYFEALHPDPPLLGTDALSIAMITCWQNRANEEGMLAASEYFRNSHPDFANRALPGMKGLLGQNAVLLERARTRLRLFYKKIDDQLSKNAYLAGPQFSMADITALCAIDFGKWSDLGADSELAADCPNLQRWYRDVSSRPSASA